VAQEPTPAAAAKATTAPAPLVVDLPAPAPDTSHGMPVVRFGVLPYLDWARVARDYEPLTKYLAERAGVRLELVLTRDYADLTTRLEAGEVDVAGLSPVLYLRARTRLGDRVAVVGHTVTRETLNYHGLFVTTKESGIRTLNEARGKRIAWVDRDSSSGYVFPRLLLKRLGHDAESFFGEHVFAGSHHRAVEMLIEGRVDVAAVWDALWKSTEIDRAQRLRVLGRSPSIPPDALVVRTGLDAAVRQRVVDALLGVRKLPVMEAEALMKEMRVRGWDPGGEGDYAPLEDELRAAGVL
jgi:phosphate/phosphite/phosphonate ABC transporter binding protein